MFDWLKNLRMGIAIGKAVATGKNKKLDKVLETADKGTEIGEKVQELIGILHKKKPKT